MHFAPKQFKWSTVKVVTIYTFAKSFIDRLWHLNIVLYSWHQFCQFDLLVSLVKTNNNQPGVVANETQQFKNTDIRTVISTADSREICILQQTNTPIIVTRHYWTNDNVTRCTVSDLLLIQPPLRKVRASLGFVFKQSVAVCSATSVPRLMPYH